jgi:hypothetical protein
VNTVGRYGDENTIQALLLFDFSELFNPGRFTGAVYNAKDNHLGGFYLVNDKPTFTDCFAVNFTGCWNFFTFTESKGILSNAVNGLKEGIAHADGI